MYNQIMYLIVLFICAFLVRLINLSQSLWLDEAVTANVIRNLTFFEILTQFSPGDFHPPLYYIFMNVWTNIFGYSEISLRMPSVFASLIAGFMVYKIARIMNEELRIKNGTSKFENLKTIRSRISFRLSLFREESRNLRSVWNDRAVLAAGLFLFNPLFVYYSQEARMYMLSTMFLSITLYCATWLVYRKTNEFKSVIISIVCFNLFAFLALTTYYGSIFFILALFIYLLIHKRLRMPLACTVGLIFGMTLLFPLLLQQLSNSQVALQSVQNWTLVLGNISFKNIVLIPLKFSTGRISFEPKLLYFGLGSVWSGILFLFVAIGMWKHKRLALLFIVPLLMGLGMSFFTPMLQYFRFQYLLLPMSLLLVFGIDYFVNRIPIISSKLIFSCMIGVFIVWSLAYLLFPQFHREDWKGLSKNISETNVPVYILSSKMDPLIYYSKELSLLSLEQIDSAVSEQIVVIPYATDIHGFDYRIHIPPSYILESTHVVRGIKYEVWQKAK